MIMKKDWILSVFDKLEREYSYLNKNTEKFPLKNTILINNDSGIYMNTLFGQLSDGTIGSKTVYVNEYKHIIDSCVILKENLEDKIIVNTNKYLTVLRSALSVAYVVYKSELKDCVIGIIGAGKINLATIYFLNILGHNNFVLLGGKKDKEKNKEAFKRMLNKDANLEFGLEKLKKAKIIIACTNNNTKKNRYSTSIAKKCVLHIVSDGGFTLDDKWRKKYLLYCDYPLQLEKNDDEEFPFDKEVNLFDSIVDFCGVQLESDTFNWKGSGVYLYGTIIADLILAKEYMKYPMEIESLITHIGFNNLNK